MASISYSQKDITDAIIGLLESGARSFVVFLPPLDNPKWRVKATRLEKTKYAVDVRLRISALNYAEKEYVRRSKAANTKPLRTLIRFDKE